jgi:hypothetical protein
VHQYGVSVPPTLTPFRFQRVLLPQGHRLEAARFRLSIREDARLAEDQDGELAGGKPGSLGAISKSSGMCVIRVFRTVEQLI